MNKNKLIHYTFNEFLKNTEVLKRYGWVPLALPAIAYGIDKVYDFFNDVMDKGYELGISKSGLTLTKAQIPAAEHTPEPQTVS